MRLFTHILDAILPPRESERIVRKTSVDELQSLSRPEHFTLLGAEGVGLLPYRNETVRAFVLEAKFHANKQAQQTLAAVLAEYLLETVADMSAFGGKIVLVPIPLSKERKRVRGYNQTEEVCRAALAQLNDSVLLMPNALTRTRDTLPQTELSGRARKENMQDAFRAAEGLDTSYTYIVVDDVVTTGATLLAATSALRARDVTKVSAIALAH